MSSKNMLRTMTTRYAGFNAHSDAAEKQMEPVLLEKILQTMFSSLSAYKVHVLVQVLFAYPTSFNLFDM